MTQRAMTAWLALFWLIGVPLFFVGPWLGAFMTTGESPQMRAPWVVGPAVVGLAVMALALHRLMTAARKSRANLFEINWLRRYYSELAGATVLYMAACIAQVLAPTSLDPTARNLLALAPVPGAVLIIAALARWVLKGDEYCRQKTLRDIGLAAGVTAAWTRSYGFLEQIGFPKLSMFWIWPSMLLAWGLCSAHARLLRR